jgi:hypothetical protein
MFLNFPTAHRSDPSEGDSSAPKVEGPSQSLTHTLSLKLCSQQCQRLTRTSISEYDPLNPNNALRILSHFLSLTLSLSLLRSRPPSPLSQSGELLFNLGFMLLVFCACSSKSTHYMCMYVCMCVSIC